VTFTLGGRMAKKAKKAAKKKAAKKR